MERWKPPISKSIILFTLRTPGFKGANANFYYLATCRIICDLQTTNGTSLSDLQNEVTDGQNLTQIVGNLTQMIARDLQRARNTRITDGNEAGVSEVRSNGGRSQSPLRSALKQSTGPQP